MLILIERGILFYDVTSVMSFQCNAFFCFLADMDWSGQREFR